MKRLSMLIGGVAGLVLSIGFAIHANGSGHNHSAGLWMIGAVFFSIMANLAPNKWDGEIYIRIPLWP